MPTASDMPVPSHEPALRSAREDRPTRSRTVWTCLGLWLAVAAIYGQTCNFQFVNFDDDVHVSENPHVTSGLTAVNLRWDFGIHGPSQWHPLAWMSHQLDCTWFGLRAGGHHITSVMLHGCNVMLLFLVLQQLTGRWGIAAFTAFAFAVHPLNVESVAWISERRNVLCVAFCLCMVQSYGRYVRRPDFRGYAVVALWHTAALMSKPLAVTMPCVLVLLDFWPLHRCRFTAAGAPGTVPLMRLIIEKLPLLFLSAGASVLTILCQRAVGTIATFDSIPFAMRITNAVAAYGWYLQKLVWPVDLGVFYPHPALIDVAPWSRLAPAAAVSLAALLLITGLALRYRHQQPAWLVGWLWYLGVMVPMIGILQVGEQQQADRYAYLPLIGLFLSLAYLGDALRRVTVFKPLVIPGAVLILGLWMILAYQQTSIWRNSVTLFSHTVAVTERNHWAHNNLGLALLRQGKYLRAADHFQKAIQAVPGYALAHVNLGTALHEMNQREAARRELTTALRLDPAQGLAHQRLAVIAVESGDLESAIAHFREAVRLAPGDGLASYNLGLILSKAGLTAEAIPWLTRACQQLPDHAPSVQALAVALHEQGQTANARRLLTAFLRQHPEQVGVAELIRQFDTSDH